MSEAKPVNVKKLTAAGIMAALVFVFTWVIHIPVPLPSVSGAYINIGDSIIYCASFLLGGYYGAAAAGIGSMLADIIFGSSYWIATLIIKGIMGFVCALFMKKPRFWMFFIACIIGGAIMVAGYAVYELVFFGAPTAVLSLPYNLFQWAGGIIVAMPLFGIMKNIDAVSKLRGDED